MSSRWRAFWQLVLARFREFYREPAALFWVYGFPIILAVLLGAAFAGSKPDPPKLVVQAGPGAEAVAERLRAAGLSADVLPKEDADVRLARGQAALALVVQPDRHEYVYDQARAEGVLARYWVEAVLARGTADPPKETPVSQRGSRYIDFLLPGLIGMNIMGGGLFGVGFVLVDMRVRKLFKRLMATPMRHSDFLLSILTSRLFFLLPEMLSLLALGRLMFDVPIFGSVPALLVTILLGACAFAGIGLLLACRTEKTETMSGLMNMVMLPMYLLSGIFFSPSRFPDNMQPVIQALPLTQLNEALRAVMLEGAGFVEIAWRLGILAGWAAITFVLALRWFKWR